MKIKLKLILMTGFLLVQLSALAVPKNKPKVFAIDVREEIGPSMSRKLSKGLDQALNTGADLIILDINTYGGLLDAADSMRTRILNMPVPVVAFINNNAASAGALISISCNKIYMRSGSSIGAATVVNENAEALPDKYQSYMRSIMRSTAEKRGRDPLIAEAMVDPRTYIPGVNDSGKVLTFTMSEAIRNQYCDGQAESIADVIRAEGYSEYRFEKYEPSAIDQLIAFLINPAVSGILLLIMLGGIYFELQAPGIGFPLVAAITAAILYFAPLYLEGLAANWEILMAIIGFILLAAEILVIPGFGIAGISGIILLVMAFAFSMVGNDGFNFDTVPSGDLSRAFATVLLSISTLIIAAFSLGGRIINSKRFNRMVLSSTLKSEEGFISAEMNMAQFVGMDADTITMLRPTGKIKIGEKTFNASAENGFIDAGSKVYISRFDGMTLWVTQNKS